MKRPIAIILAVLTFGALAHAEGDVVCVMSPNGTTASLTIQGDGGSACSWVAGATIAVQCPNAKVCYKPDGGAAVTTRDLCMNFLTASGSPDPYLISLSPSQKNISLIAAEVGDGGATADCKLAQTARRRIQ